MWPHLFPVFSLLPVAGIDLGSLAVGPAEQSGRVLRKVVSVPAEPSAVWAMWTTKVGVESFFGAEGRIELRLGGAYEILFRMDEAIGRRGAEGCVVLSFIPNEMLSFTWNAPPELGGLRNQRTFVVVRLFPCEMGTRVELSQRGWGVGAQWDTLFDYFDGAWGSVLKSLKETIADGSAPAMAEKTHFALFLHPAREGFTENPTEAEMKAVQEHFQRLKRLTDERQVVLAGPCLEAPNTGIVVFEAADADEASEFMQSDPAIEAGVFVGKVYPFSLALERSN